MISAEVRNGQRFQFLQAFQILHHIGVHGGKDRVFVGNSCRIRGEHGLDIRLISRNGAIGMAGGIHEGQRYTAQVDAAPLPNGDTGHVITPFEVIGLENFLGPHLFCTHPAKAVHDLDGLGHGEYLPRRR